MSVPRQAIAARDRRSRLARTLLLIAVILFVLPSCREEEQGRVLLFHKGTYLGPPGAKLSEQQVGALDERAKRANYAY
jgi:hypothetical protein